MMNGAKLLGHPARERCFVVRLILKADRKGPDRVVRIALVEGRHGRTVDPA
jgi:hypothetical protein